jgi:hypothetical protein
MLEDCLFVARQRLAVGADRRGILDLFPVVAGTKTRQATEHPRRAGGVSAVAA